VLLAKSINLTLSPRGSRAGGTEDAGRSSAAVSITNDLLHRSYRRVVPYCFFPARRPRSERACKKALRLAFRRRAARRNPMRLILSVCRAASVSYPRLRTSAPVVGIIMRRLSPTKFSGPRALPGWRRRSIGQSRCQAPTRPPPQDRRGRRHEPAAELHILRHASARDAQARSQLALAHDDCHATELRLLSRFSRREVIEPLACLVRAVPGHDQAIELQSGPSASATGRQEPQHIQHHVGQPFVTAIGYRAVVQPHCVRPVQPCQTRQGELGSR
jgi:hypothetical protein